MKHSTESNRKHVRPSSGQERVGWRYVPFVPVNFVQTQSGLGHFEERHLRCLSHSSCLQVCKTWRTTKVCHHHNVEKKMEEYVRTETRTYMTILEQKFETVHIQPVVHKLQQQQ